MRKVNCTCLENLEFALVPSVHDFAGGVLADETHFLVALRRLEVGQLRDPVLVFLHPHG